MSDLEARLAAAALTHKAAVKEDPRKLPRKIDVVKNSDSKTGLTKGRVIAFRDSHSEIKYTVSVSVSASGLIATEEDAAIFDGKIAEFFNSLQDEVRKTF